MPDRGNAPLKLIEATELNKLMACNKLPSPNGVALAILQLTRKETVNAIAIARAIKSDPALTGRIINAANLSSAFMPERKPVVAVPDAIVVLGLKAVAYIALGFSLISQYKNGRCKKFDYDDFWSRSLLTAIAMHGVTARTRIAAPEETFVIGLLSRVGELALATAYPEQYDLVLAEIDADSASNLATAEQARLGFNHNHLTAALLDDWGIPKALADPIGYREEPGKSPYAVGSRGYRLTQSLQLSGYLAKVCCAPIGKRHQMLPDLHRMGAELGLDADAMLGLSRLIVREWQEWGRILQVQTRNMDVLREFEQEQLQAVVSEPDKLEDDRSCANVVLRLLVVGDDERSMLLLLQKTCAAAGDIVFTAENGRQALEVALKERPHVVIANGKMPEMDGVTLCQALRETTIGRGMYLMVFGDVEEKQVFAEGHESGVDDYIATPLNLGVLTARQRAHKRVIQMQREVEAENLEMRRLNAELATTNRSLQHTTMLDSLTELPNRRYAIQWIEKEWAAAQRTHQPLSCIMIDVDCFKDINDTFGHQAGDSVLRQVAEVMKSAVRMEDVICRIGGDEFLVICPNAELVGARDVAERLRNAVAHLRVKEGEFILQTTISVGVATKESCMANSQAIIRAADEALYGAKFAGRNRTSTERGARINSVTGSVPALLS